jgi:L-lactate transport
MNPIWQQHYYVAGNSLTASALIAAIPIAMLLYLLAVKRKPVWIAAVAGLGTTLLLSITAYRMPVQYALSAALYGAAFGLFPICWIVYWAIALYRLTIETGKFEIIKDSIASLTTDRRIQALIIAFAFGAFIEGAAGFGTPVAVAAAILAGVGFSAYYASSLCLLANTAPVAFGSIGIPVITLAAVTGLPLDKVSGVVGRICAPVSLILPAYLVLTMGGFRALAEVWPAAAVAGVIFATFQFIISNYVGPQLTDIISSLAAILGILGLLRTWSPVPNDVRRRYPDANPNLPSYDSGSKNTSLHPLTTKLISAPPVLNTYTICERIVAWMPYVFLVIFVLLWGVKPFLKGLNAVSVSFSWPFLHLLIRRMPPAVNTPSLYPAVYTFNWLSASGTSCMFAVLSSMLLLRLSPRRACTLLYSTLRQLFLAILTISAVLSMAFVMNYSGITATLGLAFAATGAAFPFFSAFLGWLGVFLTGSDTSANALFGPLQVVTAGRLGINATLAAATNSAGGVMGKMISLQSIAVAAAATDLPVSDQAKVMRFTLRHSLLLAALIGIEAFLYAYVFPLA